MIIGNSHNALSSSLRGLSDIPPTHRLDLDYAGFDARRFFSAGLGDLADLADIGIDCSQYGLSDAGNGGCYDPSIGARNPMSLVAKHPSTVPTKAVTYASAPGCHVVDLTKNSCLLDNGTPYGCNAIRECDSLTHSTHYEYALPSGPTPQPGGITTVPLPTPSNPNPATPTLLYAPDLTLTNPTTPSSVFVPQVPQYTGDSNAGDTLSPNAVLPAVVSTVVPPQFAATTNPPSPYPTHQTPQPGNLPTSFLDGVTTPATPASSGFGIGTLLLIGGALLLLMHKGGK